MEMHSYALRVPREIWEEVRSAAKANRRSVNQEIVWRLSERGGRVPTGLPNGQGVHEDISNDDLIVETWREGKGAGVYMGGGHSAQYGVKITHKPTGIVVTCDEEKSQLRNKTVALARLRTALADGARAAQEPPHPDETDDVPHEDTLPCGHPLSAVVSADEGTSYCGGCAQENERSQSETTS
jgi:hypothetical protein